MTMKAKDSGKNPGSGEPAGKTFSLTDALLEPQPVDPAALERIRDQLDARGPANSPKHLMKMLSRPSCPDAVIAEIVRTGSGSQIPRITKCLNELSEAAAEAFPALGNDKVAALFTQRPEAVVAALGKIKRAAGDSAWSVFVPFQNNPTVAGLFALNPDAFVRIAEHAGEDGTRPAFERLSGVPELFPRPPEAFVNIARDARRATWEAFSALADERLAVRFAQNPDEFVRIAKHKGEGAGDAFEALAK